MSTQAAAQAAGASHGHGQLANQPVINFHHEDGDEDGDDDDDDAPKKGADKKSGRRKIKIEFINDKSRRHITFSKRKAGIMKKAYELSTLTGTQVLLLVVSETGLVYTFTTAKLQPLVTQPEGKNLIQACLNAPAGQIPTGAPIGQSGTGVHQANVHQQPPGPVPATHPASGVAQGLPPASAMPPPPRNMPGGISIGDKRGEEDEMDDDDDEGGSGDEEPISPLVSRGANSQGHPGMSHQRSPPSAGGMQRHTTHHGAPGQPRPTAATGHSTRGAHHGVHPYAGGAGGTAREAHGGHRRRTSSSAGNNVPPGGAPGKVTSPRMPIHRQASGMSDAGGASMDNQSPTIAYHPGHDPNMYAGYPGQHAQPPDGQQRMMQPYAQHQQQGPPQQAWGQVQQGVHQVHRR